MLCIKKKILTVLNVEIFYRNISMYLPIFTSTCQPSDCNTQSGTDRQTPNKLFGSRKEPSNILAATKSFV